MSLVGNRGAGIHMPKKRFLSTDLRCYFECNEAFKKDYDLRLHLKVKHRNEDEVELRRAYQAAEEEIALTRRSMCTFLCAICNKKYDDDGAFWDHTKSKHNIPWKEYTERYGRGEVESSAFECKICGSVVKYTRGLVHNHLKVVHGLNWEKYLDRMRKMKTGGVPDDLPSLDVYECKICNVTVKHIKDHLSKTHRITAAEYEYRLRQMSQGQEPDTLPDIECFECKVCGVTVKHFKDHLRNAHKIKEHEYAELFKD